MIQQLSSAEGSTWVNLSEPEPEELAQAVREAALTPSDAEFVAQQYHRPQTNSETNYLLLMLHVPTFDRSSRVTRSVPLYFVITEKQLWTIHHEPIMVLSKFIDEFENSSEKRDEYFSAGSMSLALDIVQHLYTSAFQKLERLSKHINIAEDAVFHGNERKMVEEVSLLMRDVMDFRKIIRAQTTLFQNPPAHPLLTPETRVKWLRAHNQANKLWEFLESLFESVKELSATNNSLLQHKENEILRTLTYYSIITIPIWVFVTPINPLDPDTSPFFRVLFWAILVGLFLLLVIIFTHFKRKRVF